MTLSDKEIFITFVNNSDLIENHAYIVDLEEFLDLTITEINPIKEIENFSIIENYFSTDFHILKKYCNQLIKLSIA